MTPTAVTPAARVKRATTTRGPRPSSPHRSVPRSAHRGPRAGAAAPARTVHPRRVSGPIRPSTAPPSTARPTPARRPVARPAAAGSTLRARALTAVRGLPDHFVLDRLLRGRLWIPLLGVLLVGIVAGQVEVLKANASIGSGFVAASHLQSENEHLADTVSRLSDVQRIESEAAHLGMVMPAAYMPQFLSEPGTNLDRALRDIHAPDPSAFTAALGAEATHRAADVQTDSGA